MIPKASKFNIGDLVTECAVPEAGFPLPDCRPLLIIDMVSDHERGAKTFYIVINPDGITSRYSEYELTLYGDDLSVRRGIMN